MQKNECAPADRDVTHIHPRIPGVAPDVYTTFRGSRSPLRYGYREDDETGAHEFDTHHLGIPVESKPTVCSQSAVTEHFLNRKVQRGLDFTVFTPTCSATTWTPPGLHPFPPVPSILHSTYARQNPQRFPRLQSAAPHRRRLCEDLGSPGLPPSLHELPSTPGTTVPTQPTQLVNPSRGPPAGFLVQHNLGRVNWLPATHLPLFLPAPRFHVDALPMRRHYRTSTEPAFFCTPNE